MKTLKNGEDLYTDLRPVTRDSDKVRTQVFLEGMGLDGRDLLWLDMGSCSIIEKQDTLSAYLCKGATDFEHDSAKAISLPIVGLKFESVFYGHTILSAFILMPAGGFTSSFRVPTPEFDPFSNAEWCTDCECTHPLTSYLPPHNEKLYRLVVGRKVRIYIGPALTE